MRIFAVDPGDEVSGIVWFHSDEGEVPMFEDGVHNTIILDMLRANVEFAGSDVMVAVEDIVPMGQPVGRTTLETKEWIGRFREACESRGTRVMKIPRPDVKVFLCGGSTQFDETTGRMKKVTDSTVRRAVLDRFSQTGGGKEPALGTKAEPGPLYGMSGHIFSALAVAVTAAETARIRG